MASTYSAKRCGFVPACPFAVPIPALASWTIARNDEWVAGIIAKRRKVYLASPIGEDTLFDVTTGVPEAI
jgi:hypothetical protein